MFVGVGAVVVAVARFVPRADFLKYRRHPHGAVVSKLAYSTPLKQKQNIETARHRRALRECPEPVGSLAARWSKNKKSKENGMCAVVSPGGRGRSSSAWAQKVCSFIVFWNDAVDHVPLDRTVLQGILCT